jgi:hypothetical protein
MFLKQKQNKYCNSIENPGDNGFQIIDTTTDITGIPNGLSLTKFANEPGFNINNPVNRVPFIPDSQDSTRRSVENYQDLVVETAKRSTKNSRQENMEVKTISSSNNIT